MMHRRFVALCLIAASLCAFAGCIFSPVKKTPIPKPPQKYPLLINPFSVLDAVQQDYEGRDSNEVKLLYDKDNYQGTSIDASDQSTYNTRWADEVEHVAALARSTSITQVAFTFQPAQTRFTDLSDPPGWATIQVQGLHIQIDDMGTSHLLFETGVTNEFKFVPKTPDASSPTDTTWKIIRWTEIH